MKPTLQVLAALVMLSPLASSCKEGQSSIVRHSYDVEQIYGCYKRAGVGSINIENSSVYYNGKKIFNIIDYRTNRSGSREVIVNRTLYLTRTNDLTYAFDADGFDENVSGAMFAIVPLGMEGDAIDVNTLQFEKLLRFRRSYHDPTLTHLCM